MSRNIWRSFHLVNGVYVGYETHSLLYDDVADILGSVLKTEPKWTQLPAGVPPPVRKLLRLCLEKNPKNRRSDASDGLPPRQSRSS
jgi:hypothetical protein